MNIALMNQFVPPSHAPTGILLSDLADVLRERGHSVMMVGSKDRYGRATGIFSKLREYIFFYFDARRTLMKMNPPPEVVVSMTTPPFIGLVAVALKKKKGVPFILWCMDLYPEALVASGLFCRAGAETPPQRNGLSCRAGAETPPERSGLFCRAGRNPLHGRGARRAGWVYCLLTRLTRSERTEAACIVTLGPDMTDRVRASIQNAPIAEIPVWSRLKKTSADEEAARRLRQQRGWAEDDVVCLYSGNMGRAHRVDEFIALAKRLRDSTPRVRMVFCGGGPQKESWKQRSGDLFQWLEPVEEKDLVAHLLSADIHLISQQPEWVGVVVPSKYQAACALGRPMLFAGPSESAIASWICELGGGWILPPEDDAALDRVADELSKPMSVGENRFDRSVLVGRLADRVEQEGATRA